LSDQLICHNIWKSLYTSLSPFNPFIPYNTYSSNYLHYLREVYGLRDLNKIDNFHICQALEKEEEKKLLYFIVSIFWRGTLEWGKNITSCCFNDNIMKEMISVLKEEIITLSTFKIFVEVMRKPFYGLTFPFKIYRSNGKEEYMFVIMQYMFTLIPENHYLCEQSTKDIQVIYGINKEREDTHMKSFEKRYNESEKKGKGDYRITWLSNTINEAYE
ncbi:hypothetical protein L7G72_08905, partial [Xenorhabdus bovienii]|uniref:hypothetical protein n=1 Tax=Xenorhabdus bovienii TaxID=40576 RepID=UPI001EE099CA